MGELWGVLAALFSSSIGGTAVGATRYVMGVSDPLTLAALRYGIGFIFLLPIALLQRGRWPRRRDWAGAVMLGLLFFGLFPVLFNASLAFTTAARGALALSSLPLLTLAAGAALGVERLTAAKCLGVLIAMLGVASALLSGLASAPAGAWRGDLLMVAAAFCMALYNVWSKPFLQRSAPLPLTTMGMGVGAVCLTAMAWARGGSEMLASFGSVQWIATFYLGIIGCAFVFFLWAFALTRTTPTRVAISVTVNPISASLFGALLLNEPVGWNLVLGLGMVFIGIWLATTSRKLAVR